MLRPGLIRDESGNYREIKKCPQCLEIKAIRVGSIFCSNACAKLGRNNPMFRKVPHNRVDNPGYHTQHTRIAEILGPALNYPCLECGITAFEWAHLHGTPGTNPDSDFIPLCHRCHTVYDGPFNRQTILWLRTHKLYGDTKQLAISLGVKPSTIDAVRNYRTYPFLTGKEELEWQAKN